MTKKPAKLVRWTATSVMIALLLLPLASRLTTRLESRPADLAHGWYWTGSRDWIGITHIRSTTPPPPPPSGSTLLAQYIYTEGFGNRTSPFPGIEAGTWTSSSPSGWVQAREVRIHILYLVTLPLLIVLGAVYFQAWRNRDRFGHGRCAKCGYDLRATPQRCPECGTEVQA